MNNFNILIKEYDSTWKDIENIQKLISRNLILNEGLMQSLGKAWNAFNHDRRYQKYTKQISDATKKDDSRILTALEIAIKGLVSRTEKLKELQTKIEGYKDQELVSKLKPALDDNQKQAQVFVDAAETLMKTVNPQYQPKYSKKLAPQGTQPSPAPQVNQPSAPETQSATSQETQPATPITQDTQPTASSETPKETPQDTQPTASPEIPKNQQVQTPPEDKTEQNVLNKLKNDEGSAKLGEENNKIIANGAANGKSAEQILADLRKNDKTFAVTDDVRHAIGLALGLVNRQENTAPLKENKK
jgi:vacuolar-type H+-ATPase subunit H